MERLGEFELIKRLGAGAQAEVWLAVAPDQRLVALKVMLEHLTAKDESRLTFLREARTSALLRHPNLVEIYDVGEENGRPWLSMELVRGVSLSTLWKKLKAREARLDQDEAAELVRQAALGLHFAHEVRGRDGQPLGLVHRDVSPQNIMVSEAGIAKVVDFGLAKATAQSETVTATIKGKLRYMPPEQLKSQKLDRRADVFALGAVLWELACGTQLYPGMSEAEIVQQALYEPKPHPDEVAKGLSRAMVQVLLDATARDPDKRTATAKELAEALAPLSSPSAREKLAGRMAKLFERMPRTLDEARGLDSVSSVPLSKRGRSGVLAPPVPKTSYVGRPDLGGPVPQAGAESSRARDTDQVDAPFNRNKDTEVVEAPAKHQGKVTEQFEAFPWPQTRGTDSQSHSLLDPLSGSTVVSAGTLVDPDTGVTTAPGMQTIMTALEEPPTHHARLVGSSRRTLALAAAGAGGLVALAGIVALVLHLSTTDDVSPGSGAVRRGPPLEAAAPDATGTADTPRGLRLGRVEIDCHVQAVVREHDVDLGPTPFAQSFNPGRHHLTVATPDGSSTYELDVVVKPGDVVKKPCRLGAR